MKSTSVLLIFFAILISGTIIFLSNGTNTGDSSLQNNVSIVDGKQIIEINAKGGYLPRNTVAKANIPTVIKVKTNGTFDCSAAIAIPSLGYRKNLPPSSETLIDIPLQKEGSVLQGLCAMGMYNFSIKFN